MAQGVPSISIATHSTDRKQTAGKKYLLQLGKQIAATPKLITPSKAYPKIQHVK